MRILKRTLPVRRIAYFGIRPFILLLFIILTVAILPAQFQHGARASNPQWQQFFYNGPAGSRPYFVYTPEHYQVGTAVPLIVMLHGCIQTAVDFATGTQMNQLAEQYNFVVAYPQQTSIYNPSLCWNWFNPANQFRGSGEPAIIAGIVQEIERNTARWTIDGHRIYVTGISAGGAMAVILGATYPDIFAAIGVHSGVEYRAITSLLSGGEVFLDGGPDPIQQGQEAFAAMGTMPALTIPAAPCMVRSRRVIRTPCTGGMTTVATRFRSTGSSMVWGTPGREVIQAISPTFKARVQAWQCICSSRTIPCASEYVVLISP